MEEEAAVAATKRFSTHPQTSIHFKENYKHLLAEMDCLASVVI